MNTSWLRPHLGQRLGRVDFRRRDLIDVLEHEGGSADTVDADLSHERLLRTGAPVFEIREKFGMTDMPLRNSEQSAALAVKLSDKSAVLMRGHGYCTVTRKYPIATGNVCCFSLESRRNA